MTYDILVIAGTADSRAFIEEKLGEGDRILASVATDLGAEMLASYPIKVHVGRLDVEGFTRLIRDNSVKKVADASHPFAQIVSKTVREACRITGVPYQRVERTAIDYDYDRIHVVRDVGEAVSCLNGMEGPVLLTTGVNTASDYYAGVAGAADRLFIRVLDTPASYEGCRKAGFARDHVFGEMPPYSVEDNLRLIRQTGARVMVSKDSGKTGGVDIKVEACKASGIPMILIQRPKEQTKDGEER